MEVLNLLDKVNSITTSTLSENESNMNRITDRLSFNRTYEDGTGGGGRGP